MAYTYSPRACATCTTDFRPTGARSYRCSPCQITARAAAAAPKVRARGESHRRFLDAVKLTAGCADCGYAAHPAALHFDHRPGVDKVFNIGSARQFAMPTLVAEIEKCNVVCANCHAVRTAERRAA
jgi:hypothetical protein